MLDAFKSITGGKGKDVQKQTDELQLLIATAREERSAISTMLNALTTRSAKLAPLGKQLEQVTDKATSASPTSWTRSPSGWRRSTTAPRELEDVDKRIQALKDAAKQAEQTTQKAIGPGRRAAQASRGGAAPVVAGAPDAGHARHAEEGTRRARGAARASARRREGGEAGARPCRHAQGRARSDSSTAASLCSRTTRRFARPRAKRAKTRRRDGDGQGSREEAGTARAASRAEPEHRRAARRP